MIRRRATGSERAGSAVFRGFAATVGILVASALVTSRAAGAQQALDPVCRDQGNDVARQCLAQPPGAADMGHIQACAAQRQEFYDRCVARKNGGGPGKVTETTKGPSPGPNTTGSVPAPNPTATSGLAPSSGAGSTISIDTSAALKSKNKKSTCPQPPRSYLSVRPGTRSDGLGGDGYVIVNSCKASAIEVDYTTAAFGSCNTQTAKGRRVSAGDNLPDYSYCGTPPQILDARFTK
jgi:hypothetical protein